MNKPTFELTLVAQHRDQDPDGNLRLRRALKLLLRTFGLRCTSVKDAATNNVRKGGLQMTPELREITRDLHLRVGKLHRHAQLQVRRSQMSALLLAVGHSELAGEEFVRVEAGEVLRLLNLIWAKEIEECRPRAVHVLHAPNDHKEKAPEPLSAATAD